MKRLLFLSVLVVTLALAFPRTAYAEVKTVPPIDTGEIRLITVWAAVPRDYAGETHVYLHSNQNPGGTRVLFDTLYSNDDWKLCRCYLEHMTPDTYWITASTADDGEFFGDSAGTGFPDLNQRSLVPDIDTGITSMEIPSTLEAPSGMWYYEAVPIDAAGFPQFFCIFDSIEQFPETVASIEPVFRELMKEYAAHIDELYGHRMDEVIDAMVPLYMDAGHFDDYVSLYLPAGFFLNEYAHETKNSALGSLESPYSKNGALFDKKALEEPESEYAESRRKNDNVILLKDWGWDIRYDTRNLEYDENGNCITEFRIGEDGNINLFFPDLGDEIPDDLPLVVLPDGSVSQGGPVPSVSPDIPGKEPGDDTEHGDTKHEEKIESFPTDKPEKPGTDKDKDSQETRKKSVPFLPVAGVAVLIAGIAVFIKKRKL